MFRPCRNKNAAGLILLILAAATDAQAQHLKLLAGSTSGTFAPAEDAGMVFEWLPGAAFGGGLEWRHGRLVSELDVIWVQKRGRYASRAWDFTVSELSVPVLLGIRGRGRVALSGMAGVEVAYILSATQAGVSGGRETSYETPAFDCGLVAGGGVAFAVGRRLLTLEARYTHGLVKTMKFYSDGYDFRTRTFTLLGGVVF